MYSFFVSIDKELRKTRGEASTFFFAMVPALPNCSVQCKASKTVFPRDVMRKHQCFLFDRTPIIRSMTSLAVGSAIPVTMSFPYLVHDSRPMLTSYNAFNVQCGFHCTVLRITCSQRCDQSLKKTVFVLRGMLNDESST